MAPPKPVLRAKLHVTQSPLVFSNGVKLRVESRALQIRGGTGVDTGTVVTSIYLDGTRARILHFEGPDADLDTDDLRMTAAMLRALGIAPDGAASFIASVNRTRADAFADPLDA